MKDDPTAAYERIAEELLKEQRHFINVIGPSLQNRPAFSEPKPKEVQHQEFVEARDAAMAGDPTLLQARLKMFVGVSGFEGKMQMLKWLTKHSEMVAEMPRHDVMEENHADANAY